MYKYTYDANEEQLTPAQRRRFQFVREMTFGFHDVNIEHGGKLYRFTTPSEGAFYFATHLDAGLSLFDLGETPWFVVEVITRHEAQLISRALTKLGFWFPIRLATKYGFALIFRFNFNYGPAQFCGNCERALEGLAERFGSVRFGVHGSDCFLVVRDVLLIPEIIDVNDHDLLSRVANPSQLWEGA